MNTKIITIFKQITIALIVVLSFMACEKEFKNIGGNIVDNDSFDTKKTSFDVVSYNKNIEASRVDNIETTSLSSLLMPLGIYDTEDFGLFKSSVIAQVNPPFSLDWGENINLDAVYLEIPYSAIRDGSYDDGKPKFKLNNVTGQAIYKIQVARLETYLSKLDPSDPSKYNKYYSNDSFSTSDILYPFTDFSPSEVDTVLYFDRTMLDTSANAYADIQVQDTIKISDTKPFIRIPLDKDFFNDEFINNTDQSIFDDNNNFYDFFKGIAIDVQGDDGTVMMLDYNTAKINMYYTNKEYITSDESDIDLNGDGDTDDEDVTFPVRTKKTMSFSLTGIKTNKIERDYTAANINSYITSPDEVNGEDKLFINGAQGSIAVIDLFNNEDLDELRAKNWLINEANLIFHIDNENDNDVPNRLLLYKLDPDETDDNNENTQILDAITEVNTFNGFLQKDGEAGDDNRNPIKYKVNITDYISEVLKQDNSIELSRLALKLYNGLDTPANAQDIKVSDYSWNPQGVVLYGNNYSQGDADYSKRLKLEIYYTELNN